VRKAREGLLEARELGLGQPAAGHGEQLHLAQLRERRAERSQGAEAASRELQLLDGGLELAALGPDRLHGGTPGLQRGRRLLGRGERIAPVPGHGRRPEEARDRVELTQPGLALASQRRDVEGPHPPAPLLPLREVEEVQHAEGAHLLEDPFEIVAGDEDAHALHGRRSQHHAARSVTRPALIHAAPRRRRTPSATRRRSAAWTASKLQ
jgi:hypothetical protein